MKEQHIITYGGCFFIVLNREVDTVFKSKKLSCSQVECLINESCLECCLSYTHLDLSKEGVEHHIIKY